MLQCGLIMLLTWGAAPEDLLKNGSFEQVVGAKPAAWDFYMMPQPGAKAAVEGEVAYDGDYSVMLRNAQEYANDPCNNWSQNVMVPLSGKRVLVSGYIKTEGVGSASIWLQCWRSSPLGVTQVNTTEDEYPCSGFSDWTPVRMTVDVPSGTDFLTLRCVLKGRGAAWFDSISMTESDSGAADMKATRPPPARESRQQAPVADAGGESGDKSTLDMPSAEDDKEHTVEEPLAEPLPDLPDLPVPLSPPPPLATPSSALSTTENLPEDVVVSAEELKEAIHSLKTTNENLADEVGRLQDEIRSLKEQIDTLRGSPATQSTSLSPASGSSAGAEELAAPKRRVPPLVPHGYNLEERP